MVAVAVVAVAGCIIWFIIHAFLAILAVAWVTMMQLGREKWRWY